ncbi:hypothetical protein DEO72_LG8g2747 [Vigna unguiculata]|uniref:Uncharacterized protein n=1 Tax=Vigna unguiculata TaxID=3917 RepID=A0A4D6MX21_VIGUN|nr:hypothetical protein DEO72_LG8g2747 [Vigna unguiculata]
MGRGGRKSQNQKFRVTKIRNLGYKSGEREPERKLRTNLSSRWSWRSESSANHSPMVALRSPALRCFLAAANDVVDVTVEEKRVWPAVTWWPACFLVASGDVGGGEASMCMAQRRESRRRVQ